MIVDAHVHIYPAVHGRIAGGNTTGLGYGRVGVGQRAIWALPPFAEDTAFSAEALVAHMDWAGVDKAVVLQNSFYGQCNGYVEEAAQRYAERLTAAAFFDPWREGSRQAFAPIADRPVFKAVKLEFSEATGLFGIYPGARLDSPDLHWLWESLETLDKVLVLDLGAVGSGSYQTRAVRTIAEDHPKLKIVIAHLGQPAPTVESDAALMRLWEEQIDLGRLANVWFDCASLPAYLAEEGYPYQTAARYVGTAIHRIGPRKIMWGTDIPSMLLHATYRQLVRVGWRCSESVADVEKRMFMGENAMQVFGIE